MVELTQEQVKGRQELAEMELEKYNFITQDKLSFRSQKGISEAIVEDLSKQKDEPKWMLDLRLKALKHFLERPLPEWGPNLHNIDFEELTCYIRPDSKKVTNWEDVPKEIKDTFDKIGVPEAEQKYLAGSVAQYESDTIYHNLQEKWAKQGVIFTDVDTAMQEHPDLVKKYFMQAVPIHDNKFSALHAAFWSGGSFVYVPEGVKVDLPLQAYYRMNAAQEGQFEHTLIIAEPKSKVHFLEGCFTAGTSIRTEHGIQPIEEVQKEDKVLTHEGNFKRVYFTQVRPYTGVLHKIHIYGDTTQEIEATEEHPFYAVRRKYSNERNKEWNPEWAEAKNLQQGDYVAIPINKKIISNNFYDFEISMSISDRTRQFIKVKEKVKANKDFFKLAGYFLSEGSTNRGFSSSVSFNVNEKEYIDETKLLFSKVFGVEKFCESVHKTNHGISITVSGAKIARVLEHFGHSSNTKQIPEWMMLESPEKQAELIKSLYFGDGSYMNKKYAWGRKEMFRINTVSKTLAYQVREILLRLGIASSINKQVRKAPRQIMYAIVIGGEYMQKFGALVGEFIETSLNSKKRATMFFVDENYMYAPIKKIETRVVENLPVYNFGVEEDESYSANMVAVHNCTAPKYSEYSLHSAVVEIYVKDYADARYTTVQNWSKNVYNLNTKRSLVDKNAKMEWVGGSLGSYITMLYPCTILRGDNSTATHLNIAFGSGGTWKDGGAKVIHVGENTKSNVIAKSISMGGGTSVYRGLLRINKGAKNASSYVCCSGLILDDFSKSYAFPHNEIYEPTASIAHEATVNKISDEQIFYLTSRGLTDNEARSMIVLGFLNEVARELPLEYAIEFSRLVNLEVDKLGTVG
ncbi:MAG: SufD family Fe-S cluster assembly protein [Candidatus Diapherotrites archaeon]|nr:SufD family Fe-S cluster assembly protein [Candidatus Diapherotrites archaeon]